MEIENGNLLIVNVKEGEEDTKLTVPGRVTGTSTRCNSSEKLNCGSGMVLMGPYIESKNETVMMITNIDQDYTLSISYK